ncbi:MAG: hypothetical protein V3V08_23555 [Nannocystaceae bacterium]
MIIETRFNVGDTVFRPYANTCAKQVQCPDCLGSKHWEAHLPNGEQIPIWCPTCEFGYEHRGTIAAGSVEGTVQRLTVGTVGIEEDNRSEGVGGMVERYMCEETGVGSGAIHYGYNLCATHEEAEAKLPEMIEAMKKHLAESNATCRKRKIEDGPGQMAAYYRAQIRDAKKTIKTADERLAREPSTTEKAS